MFFQEYFLCILHLKLHSKAHLSNTLECNLFPKVLSDVLFANYTQRYFQK